MRVQAGNSSSAEQTLALFLYIFPRYIQCYWNPNVLIEPRHHHNPWFLFIMNERSSHYLVCVASVLTPPPPPPDRSLNPVIPPFYQIVGTP